MDDFTYDVIEKKRTARGAYHRKRGSKSRRCVMPSDLMTKAERERLNGAVKNYNLSAPMKWAEFKKMPDDLQKEYLEKTAERFRASSATIARECLCVAPSALKKWMDDRKWKLAVRGTRMTSVERGVWLAWINGMIEDVEPEKEPVQLDPLEEITSKEEKRPAEELEMVACDVHSTFVGEVTANSLMRALARITVPTGRCRVTFHIERLQDGQ